MEKISFIGAGNMGYAIAKALSDNNSYKIGLYSLHFENTVKKADEIGAVAYKTIQDAIFNADMIILAVKPQTLPSLYEVLRDEAKGKLIISIAAGISLKTLMDNLDNKNIIRFMPNIAASKKASVTAYTYCDDLALPMKEKAEKIASSFGSAFYLREQDFSAFIGISGSAIAYVFAFLHALALGGTKAGIPYKRSLEIATDTMNSALKLQKNSDKNPIELMSDVCSPGGTTIEGIEALLEGKFEATVMNAVLAAYNKNLKLENSNK